MLVRDSRRLVLFAVLFVAFVYGVLWYRSHSGPIVASGTVGRVGETLPGLGSDKEQPAPASPDRPETQNIPDLQAAPDAPPPPSPPEPPAAPPPPFPPPPAPPAEPPSPPAAAAPEPNPPQAFPAAPPARPGDPVAAALAALPPVDAFATHLELFSTSTVSREYFELRFGDQKTMNPNVLPHPTRANTWILVAQKHKAADEQPQWWFSELACAAEFAHDVLACTGPAPATLPIAATGGGRCEGALDYFNLNVGPHDARVFYGPDAPYALYGSNSGHTCFGQWLQDFRALYPWDRAGDLPGPGAPFRLGAELQRPPPWARPIEKNWFLFWDAAGHAYVHHDLAPRRVFAALRADGSVGPDLAAAGPAAARDAACLARRLPALAPADESLHQATNSLAVTLCRRADGPACARRPDNTVLLALFHHKSFRHLHAQYEPYAVLFDDAAPFALRGLSSKPLWLAGRRRHPDDPRRPSDMLFVTSIAWRAAGQTYHGFLDDVLFISFGIEDERSAALDVRAEDLLRGVGLCEDEAQGGRDGGMGGKGKMD